MFFLLRIVFILNIYSLFSIVLVWKPNTQYSFDPIVNLLQSLESHAKIISESRFSDKKRIQDLERELSNCSQEIGKTNFNYIFI